MSLSKRRIFQTACCVTAAHVICVCLCGVCVFVKVFEGVYNNARMLHFLTAVVVSHVIHLSLMIHCCPQTSRGDVGIVVLEDCNCSSRRLIF